MSPGAVSPRRFWRLLAGDAVNILRDPMLVFATAMSLVPSIVLALTRDAMDAAALSGLGIAGFSRFVVPVALLVPAALVGWVSGFLLLEDRDEGTLLAVDVTPLGKAGLLAYRMVMTGLAAGAVTLLAWPLLLPDAPAAVGLGAVLLVAANAALAAIVLPAFARNKVEGLALTKLTNLAALVPLLALVPSPLRLLAGAMPSYWLGELLGLGGPSPVAGWVAAPIGLAASGIAFALLLRLFLSRLG